MLEIIKNLRLLRQKFHPFPNQFSLKLSDLSHETISTTYFNIIQIFVSMYVHVGPVLLYCICKCKPATRRLEHGLEVEFVILLVGG